EFLNKALAEFDGQNCPVCETQWNPEDFRQKIQTKLEIYKSLSEEKRKADVKLTSFANHINQAQLVLDKIARLGSTLNPDIDSKWLEAHAKKLSNIESSIRKFFPVSDVILSINNFDILPAEIAAVVTQINTLVIALPEPSQQDSAREFLIVAQERL